MKPVRCLISVLVALAWALAVNAPASDPDDLVKLRTIYTNEMARFEAEYQTAVKAWPAAYRQELTTLKTQLQKAGDLEGWHATDKELTRFAAKANLPSSPDKALPEALQALQKRFRQEPDDARIARARHIVELTQKYEGRLQTSQTSLTVAGELQEAMAYNAEIKRVKATPDVTSAEFDVAEDDARRKAEAPPPLAPTSVPDKPTTPTPVKTPAAPTPKPPEGVKIIEGSSAPPVPGLTFKDQTMTPSDRMKLTRKLSVKVMLASESEMRRDTSSYYYYSSSSKSGSMHHFLRVGIRSGSSQFSAPGCRLLVEFFARDIGGAAGKVDAKPVGSQLIDLPVVDASRWIFVDLPPLSLSSSSYRSTGYYYYGGSSSYKSGMQFYGAVISVFDAENNLISQSSTEPALNLNAPAALPEGMLKNRGVEGARMRVDTARRNLESARAAWLATPGDTALEARRAAQEELTAAEEALRRAQRRE